MSSDLESHPRQIVVVDEKGHVHVSDFSDLSHMIDEKSVQEAIDAYLAKYHLRRAPPHENRFSLTVRKPRSTPPRLYMKKR